MMIWHGHQEAQWQPAQQTQQSAPSHQKATMEVRRPLHVGVLIATYSGTPRENVFHDLTLLGTNNRT